MNTDTIEGASRQGISCLVCGEPLSIRPATGRKSGKPFIMLICSTSGKHFRGFITDQSYVAGVMGRIEGRSKSGASSDENESGGAPA